MRLPDMVDVALELEASASMPAGFEWPLYRGIVRLAPWLEHSASAGILPLRGARLADGALLLARRAKLVVRMPRERMCAATVLEGAVIDVSGTRLAIGRGNLRSLRSNPTLYSPRVALGEGEELTFGRRLAGELRRLRIDRPFLCGRRVEVDIDARREPAYGVAVHGLSADESLALQAAGLGHAHGVGCGLFMPHKSIGGSA